MLASVASLIVASTPYAADLVRVLSCEKPAPVVDVLVATDTDPHTFTLLPASRGRIAKAKLFLYVHREFESWLPLASHGKDPAWFEMTSGLDTKGALGAIDPHVWHSPTLTVEVARRMATRLGTVYPDRAAEFLSCASKFATAVTTEVVALKTLVAALAPERRMLATNHDAFGYFASTFGFKVLTVRGVSNEAASTPARLKKVIEGVRAQGVKAVFLETSVADRTMERVAKEAGVKLGGELHADGLGGPGSGAETTLALWRKNVETVVSALK